MSGMKKHVTLRCGIWIMAMLPGVRLAAEGQDQIAAEQHHPRRQDVERRHEQAAAGGRDRRGVSSRLSRWASWSRRYC